MLDSGYRVVVPAEEFLEYLRVQGTPPNTVKSYARALALWWTYLSVFGLAWDELTLADVGGFLAWLRGGDGPQLVSIGPRPARFTESTISTRLRAVTSCYRFHELNGVGWAVTWSGWCTAAGPLISRCSSTWRAGKAVSVR